jgi:tetratricopeptide (TPR) repeat protein
MNPIAYLVFFSWIPVIFVIFSKLPVRRATVVALVTAWLFLPQVIFELPGIPDFKRTTATSIGILLALMAFAPALLRALRFRWFDLPMLIWCLAPSMSSLANDLGPYDAASNLLEQLVTWGLPYLIGRACLGDSEGLREFSVSIVIGGLSYVPLALIEMRLSPQLHSWVYGFNPRSDFGATIRYGGYRPQIFMASGLEVGMYMVAASLVGYWIWSGGVLHRLRGVPFKGPLVLLVVTTILCKSTGALLLMVVGVAVLWAATRLGTRLPALGLVLIAPLYCGVRSAGVWDGRVLVAISSDSAGADRAGSLEFRLDNEDMLINKAMERPVFGWSGWGRARVFDTNGKDLTITDGLWVIALGNYGVVGLTALTLVFILPLTWFAIRYPPRKWNAPGLAPAAVLAVILALYMIDNLSNSMTNLIYITAAGALLGAMSNLGEADHSSEVDHSYRYALESDAVAESAIGVEARTLQGEAERAWRAALEPPDGEAPIPPDQDGERAHGYSRLGHWLTLLGRHREGAEALACALELRAARMDRTSDDLEARQHYADALNELAWALATCPDPTGRDPAKAAALADRAVKFFPENPGYHKTLGASFCRSRDWSAAILALGRSFTLSRGGDHFDHLLMAIALAGRGNIEAARESLRCAERAADARAADSPEWGVMHADAVAFLTADNGSAGEGPRALEASAEPVDHSKP